MKKKITKLFGIKIWETEVLESSNEVKEKDINKLKRVRQEGAVIDFSPEDEERERQREIDKML